ncbi:MAG: DUF6056 family protein [Anaerolineae bacterium]|nr:DUF6056 family protein [Anaerolineae bacterium]
MAALPRRLLISGWLYGLPFALALLLIALLGSYSRPLADDYCTAADGLRYGPAGMVSAYRDGWSGLYTNFFLKGLAAPLHPGLHIYLTAATVAGLWLAAAALLYEVCRTLRMAAAGFSAALLATIGVCALLTTAPDEQALYWFGAIIPYTLPLIVLLLAGAGLLRLLRAGLPRGGLLAALPLSLTLAFLNAGLSETATVFQGGLLLLLSGLAGWRLRGDLRRGVLLVLLLALAGTAIGLLTNLSAPGNAARQVSVEAAKDYDSGSIDPVLLMVLAYAFAVQTTITPAALLACLGVFVTAAALTWRFYPPEQTLPWRRLQRYFNLSIPAAFSLAALVIAVPLYGVAHPSPRALLVVRLWQIMVVVAWGWLAGQTLRRRGALQTWLLTALQRRGVPAVLLALVWLAPLASLAHNAARLPAFAAYAAAWDARDAFIRQAAGTGAATVTITPQPTYLEDTLALDTLTTWRDCAARWYGIGLELRAESQDSS